MKKKHLYLLTAAFALSALLVGCDKQSGNNLNGLGEVAEKSYTLDEAKAKVQDVLKYVQEDYMFFNDRLIVKGWVNDDGEFLEQIKLGVSFDKNKEIDKIYIMMGEDFEGNEDVGNEYIKGKGTTEFANGKETKQKYDEEEFDLAAEGMMDMFKDRTLHEMIDTPIGGTFVSAEEKDGVYAITYKDDAKSEVYDFGTTDEDGIEQRIYGSEEYYTVTVDKYLNLLGWTKKTVDLGKNGESVEEYETKTEITEYK